MRITKDQLGVLNSQVISTNIAWRMISYRKDTTLSPVTLRDDYATVVIYTLPTSLIINVKPGLGLNHPEGHNRMEELAEVSG